MSWVKGLSLRGESFPSFWSVCSFSEFSDFEDAPPFTRISPRLKQLRDCFELLSKRLQDGIEGFTWL